MLQTIKRFLRDDEGPTAVEYAIMVAGIAVVIIAVVFLLGNRVTSTLHNVADHLPGGAK